MNTKSYFIILATLICFSVKAQDHLNLPDSIKIEFEGNYGLSIVQNYNNEKYGLIDSTGSFVLFPRYEYIFPFHEELALVYHNDRFGFIDLEGNIKIPIDYTTGNHFKNGKAIVSKYFVSGVIDKSNNVVIPFKYEALQTLDHTSYHFQTKPNKSGLMDSQEQVIIEPIYDIMMKGNDSLWIARLANKFVILKNNGDLHSPIKFDKIGRQNSLNLRRVSVEKKIGFIDEHYNIIIPTKYKASGPVIGKLIAVNNGNKWGFIDQSNSTIIEFIYDDIKNLNDENAIIRKERMWNIINKNGELKLKENIKYIEHIENSDLIFMDGHLYDLELNKKTESQVRLHTYNRFGGMEHGMMKVYINNKLGYVDSLGTLKIEPYYDDGAHFYEKGCTAINKNGKWGFIRSNNELITEINYDSIYHFGTYSNCDYIIFKDGLFGIFLGDKVIFEPQFQEILIGQDNSLIYREGEKYGIINENTFELDHPIYDKIVAHGLGYEVEKEGKFGLLDKSLNILVPTEYDYIEHRGYYLVAKLNGKFGTISLANEIIQDFSYDKIEMTPLDIIRTYKNGKIGTLCSNGMELLPPIYDKISKVNYTNVEVFIGGKSEIINIAKLETEIAAKNNKK